MYVHRAFVNVSPAWMDTAVLHYQHHALEGTARQGTLENAVSICVYVFVSRQ